MILLKLDHISAFYGPSQALFDVSLEIAPGEVVALMGRNGMGKSTTVKVICRLVKNRGGTVLFENRNIGDLPPFRAARAGIGLVPEGRRCFGNLTVRENLLAAARPGDWTLETVGALFPRLTERHDQSAGSLSGGEQQMLTIGRALMTNPDLILIDEATEGLAPLVARDIWTTLGVIRGEGIATIVVDKDFRSLAKIVDRVVLLAKGAVMFDGAPGDLTSRPELLERHLGV